MQQRSCTPTRVNSSGDSPFVLYRRSWDRTTSDLSATPPRTPVLGERAFSNEMLLGCNAASGCMPLDAFSSAHTAFCTPQTSRRELDLRASLDYELNRVNEEARWRQTTTQTLVTPLTEYLFIGPYPTEDTARFLLENNIEIVVNCCAGERPTDPEIRKAFIVKDIAAVDSTEYFILMHNLDDFVSIINSARQAGKKVFVHCVAGVNRSAVLCAAYLMKAMKWGPIEVVRHFRQMGKFCMLENVAFRHQLISEYLATICAGEN
jgi:hypothetical protein